MSSERKKHSFSVDEGSDLEKIMNYLNSAPRKTLKGTIEDTFHLMFLPYALHESGASSKEVAFHALESIRRMNQEISSLTMLIKITSGIDGELPRLPTQIASMVMRNIPSTSATAEATTAKAEEEPEAEPKRLSKYVNEPF